MVRKWDSRRNDIYYFLFTDQGEEPAASERSLLPPLLWFLLHCPGRHAARQGTHFLTDYFLHFRNPSFLKLNILGTWWRNNRSQFSIRDPECLDRGSTGSRTIIWHISGSRTNLWHMVFQDAELSSDMVFQDPELSSDILGSRTVLWHMVFQDPELSSNISDPELSSDISGFCWTILKQFRPFQDSDPNYPLTFHRISNYPLTFQDRHDPIVKNLISHGSMFHWQLEQNWCVFLPSCSRNVEYWTLIKHGNLRFGNQLCFWYVGFGSASHVSDVCYLSSASCRPSRSGDCLWFCCPYDTSWLFCFCQVQFTYSHAFFALAFPLPICFFCCCQLKRLSHQITYLLSVHVQMVF